MRKIVKLIGLMKLFLYKLSGIKVSYNASVFFHPKSKIKVNDKSSKITLKPNCNILNGVEISLKNNSELVIENRVAILERSYITIEDNAKLTIQEDTFLNKEAKIFCLQEINIGKNVAIGTNVSMFDHDHIVKPNVKQDWSISKREPINIEDNVWIGANAL